MVEWNHPVRRGLISGVDTTNNVVTGGGSTIVQELLVAKRLDDVVEVMWSTYRKPSKEDCSCFV